MKVTIAFMLFALSCFFATCASTNSSEMKEIEPMEQNYLLRRVQMCIDKYDTVMCTEADDSDFQKRCILNGAFILLGDLDGVLGCKLDQILQELECFGMTIAEMKGVITGETKVYNLDSEVCENTLSGMIDVFKGMMNGGSSGSPEELLQGDGTVEEEEFKEQLGEVLDEYEKDDVVEKTADAADVSEKGIDSRFIENDFQEGINDNFEGMIDVNDGSTFDSNMEENGEGSLVIKSIDTQTEQEPNDMKFHDYEKIDENMGGLVGVTSHSTDENGEESEEGVAQITASIGVLAERFKGAIGGQTQGSSWKYTGSEGGVSGGTTGSTFGVMKGGTFGSKQGETGYKTKNGDDQEVEVKETWEEYEIVSEMEETTE